MRNEWVDDEALHLARLFVTGRLNTDCCRLIAGWLPLNPCSSCYRCGYLLAAMNQHGVLFVSSEAQHSMHSCSWCSACEM